MLWAPACLVDGRVCSAICLGWQKQWYQAGSMKVVFEFFEMNKNIKFCPGYLLHRKNKQTKKLWLLQLFHRFSIKMKTKLIMLRFFCSISCTPVFGGYFYDIPLLPFTFICRLNFKITQMFKKHYRNEQHEHLLFFSNDYSVIFYRL